MMPIWISRNGWTARHVGLLAGLLVGAIAVCWEAWQDIATIALGDEEMSHILLVPVVMAWLLWVRRRRLRFCKPTGTMAGPLIMALGWLLFSMGDNLLIQSAWHLGAIVVLVGAVVTVLGWQILWRFGPVWVAMIFLVPVPGTLRGAIAIPMQNMAAIITQSLLEVLGVPLQRSGNLLTINGVDVAIAEACNGLRMVFALTLVSFVFAYGTTLRNGVRMLIVLTSPILALGINVIRISLAVWFYGYFSPAWADGYHTFSGWIMLPISFLVLMGIIRLLRWALIPVSPYTLAAD